MSKRMLTVGASKAIQVTFVTALAAGCLAGCGNRDREATGESSSGRPTIESAPPAGTSSGIQIIESVARVSSDLMPLIAPRDDGWKREGTWLTSPTLRAGVRENQVGARLSVTADGRLEVEHGSTGKYAVQLSFVGARPVPAQLDRGRALYPSAFESTDVVVTVLDSMVEQFVVLRDERAPREFAWQLGHTPALPRTVRDPDGSLVFEDAKGEAVLGILAPVAVDAAGRHRQAKMTLDGTMLRVRLDTHDLAYPIVLDPAVQQWLWTDPAPAQNPGQRYNAASTVYKNKTTLVERMLIFGGNVRVGSTTTYSNELWQWNTNNWSKITVAGGPPTALAEVAMASSSKGGFVATYGGRDVNGTITNESWKLTNLFSSPAWTKIPTDNGIYDKKLIGHRMFSYTNNLLSRDRVYVFGGEDVNGYIPTSALVTDDGQGWATSTPGAGSLLLRRHMAIAQVYRVTGVDTYEETAYLFGGIDENDAVVGGLWKWDDSAKNFKPVCTACNPAPSVRYRAQMAYDRRRGVLVLYGGYQASLQPLSDTWEFDIESSTWTQITPVGAPGNKTSASMQWAVSPNRVMMQGGMAFTGMLNTYSYRTWQFRSRGGTCPSNPLYSCDDFCVDTVCCDVQTCGTCERCDGTAPGTCTTVAAGEPDDSCPAGHVCNAAKQCKKSLGQDCTSASECYSGFCADGKCCDTACNSPCDVCKNGLGGNTAPNGTCATVPQGWSGDPSCEPVVCNGTQVTCPGATCVKDSDCVATAYCSSAGTCQPRKELGTSCDTATDCYGSGACRVCSGTGDGYCTDGVCCSAACAGACDVCKNGLAGSTSPDGTCVFAQIGYPGSPTCGAYACSGSGATCPTGTEGCTTDAQCNGGYYCAADATCKARKADGQTCNVVSGQDCLQSGCRVCSSGFCTDGYCCNSACDQSCDLCNKAGSEGACSPAGAGLPGTPSCAPYECSDGATCAATCATNADCTTGFFCDTTNLCVPQAGVGSPCSVQANCSAGLFCIDGVCCMTDCVGACLACSQAKKGQGEDGICGFIANGADPDTECADQLPSSCGSIGTCNGAGACALHPEGTDCGSPSCTSGAQVTSSCNGFGQCLPSLSTPCSPYVCSGNTCATSCTDDTGCVGMTYCNLLTHKCETKLANGAPCNTNAMCQYGVCVDGVCCDSACSAPCMACSAAKKGTGADGECGYVVAEADPDADCSIDPPSSCGKDGFCNGAGACKLYVAGTKCGNAQCSGNSLVSKLCDGLGFCGSEGSTDCAPYLCQADQCTTSCAANSQCAMGSVCLQNGTCSAPLTNGEACAKDDECSSKHCADGVCCNTACDGQCAVCNDLSSKGTCIGHDGAPVGDRPPCTATDADCAGTCQAADMSKCAYPGDTKRCSTSTCDGAVAKPMVCNGQGACEAGPTKNCLPYACDATTKDCKTSCTVNADCATGAECNQQTQQCAITTATCKDSFTVKEPDGTETSCTPYKCQAGACRTTCDLPADCSPGYECKGSKCEETTDGGAGGTAGSGTGGKAGSAGSSAGTAGQAGSGTGGDATPPAQEDSSDGGCGCRVAGAPDRRGAAGLLLLAVALAWRSRRRSTKASLHQAHE